MDLPDVMRNAAAKPAILLALLTALLLSGCTMPASTGDAQPAQPASVQSAAEDTASAVYTMANLPDYSGSPYVELNGNQPKFDESQFNTDSYEFYTDLDQLGRCGACYANIGQDLMPTEERGSISSVHPSGWVQTEYDCVDGKNLYNRCHLIGFQLTGENANEHNLITGTRYLNVDGMLPFENQVADYIRDTGHHVLYRVTPDFRDSELVARGVEMEAASVEDDTIRFHVYCYNVQPGVIIDYATGESQLADSDASAAEAPAATDDEAGHYILNTRNKKFHLPDCSSVADMNPENKEDYTGFRSDLIQQGYDPCGRCKP